MSKSNVKQRYIQLTEWLKTMDNSTRKTPKPTNNKPLDYNIRIKNG